MERLFPLKGKYYLWLLLPAGVVGVLAYKLVRAEEVFKYSEAQAYLLSILLLFALMAWGWWKTNPRPDPQSSVEAVAYNRAIRRLLRLVAIGYAGLLLTATRWDFWRYRVVAKAIGLGTLVAGAFFVSGILLGLLFGFRPTGTQSSGNQSPGGRPHPPHTNLEEIADWLTKIILGATLVELTNLLAQIKRLARFMARAIDPPPPLPPVPPLPPGEELAKPAIALAIMGFFFASGVLYGYLWSRYEVALATDTSDADASALALVTSWLNAPSTPDDHTRADMMQTAKAASPAAKLRMFVQAEQYRKPSTPEVNDRSLPVFQALVESDLQEVFHRSPAQYAFALMGRTKTPQNADDDWTQALDLLNKAIRIRNGSGEKGWLEYELARAVCQIHLDPNFKTSPSDRDRKQSILADLHKATDIPKATQKTIDTDDAIDAWKKLNPEPV
jgi:hypothetical protein